MTRGRPAAGVHLIVGDKLFDSYLAEQELARLMAEAVDQAEAVETQRGDETSWARVLDSARMRSLFATRRALVVRGAEALKGEPEGLEAYLDDPTPGVTLVFVAAKLDRRKGGWKRLFERARVFKAEPLKGAALRREVAQQIRRRQLPLTAEATEELVARVGQDLRRLMGELDKLEAFAAGREEVGPEEVAALLGRGLAPPLYRLSDAVGERDAARALEIVEALIEEGEPAVLIVGALHRSLRQIRAVAALRRARAPQQEMLSRLRLGPTLAFKLKGLLEASRRWTEADVAEAMRALGRADRRLKTGGDPRVSLEIALVEALGARPSSPATRAR